MVLELKARFDEQANIRWAGFLEEAGIHVTYGVVGLKTHCKVIFVVRKDSDGLRRYAHIGTGNYHAGTARMYCDLGLLTCDPDIGADLTELFNYLTTGYTPMRRYRKLLPSPRLLKKALLRKIEREIRGHSQDNPGLIQLKANALEDREIVAALYRASQAGVHVDLIIRDTCRLRPALPAFRQHPGGVAGWPFPGTQPAVLFPQSGRRGILHRLGRSDAAQPGESGRGVRAGGIAKLRKQLRQLLNLQLTNKRNAWEMQADGDYVQRVGKGRTSAVCIHRKFIELAEKRLAAADRSMIRKKTRKKSVKG